MINFSKCFEFCSFTKREEKPEREKEMENIKNYNNIHENFSCYSSGPHFISIFFLRENGEIKVDSRWMKCWVNLQKPPCCSSFLLSIPNLILRCIITFLPKQIIVRVSRQFSIIMFFGHPSHSEKKWKKKSLANEILVMNLILTNFLFLFCELSKDAENAYIVLNYTCIYHCDDADD